MAGGGTPGHRFGTRGHAPRSTLPATAQQRRIRLSHIVSIESPVPSDSKRRIPEPQHPESRI